MNRSLLRRMAFPAVCLLVFSAAAALLAFWYAARQLALLDGFCTALIARAPESADAVYALVKEGSFASAAVPGVLAALGYRPRDFAAGTGWLYAVAGGGLSLGGCPAGRDLASFPPGCRPAAAEAHRIAGSCPHRPPPDPAHRGRDDRGQLRPPGR